jgi:hypothetical protein
MPDKTCVSVKCDAQNLYDSKLKPSLVKAMTGDVSDAIDNHSGGKLTTPGNGD